jgi:hypothetical protein
MQGLYSSDPHIHRLASDGCGKGAKDLFPPVPFSTDVSRRHDSPLSHFPYVATAV